MATGTISLKIHFGEKSNVQEMQFEKSMTIDDVCKLIQEGVSDTAASPAREYGLFQHGDNPTTGQWLEGGRPLEHYHLKSGDLFEFRKKMRPLLIRTLDGVISTLPVDDSQTVAKVIRTVCTTVGLQNVEEYSFSKDEKTSDQIQSGEGHKDSDQNELGTLKLHMDEELNWLNPDQTLYEQGIDETVVVTLRKKYVFSEENVDSNNPVHLNQLYIQCRDAIVGGTYPCTQEEATQFAALQCLIQYGNLDETKHKSGILNLVDFLPKEYRTISGIEESTFSEHCKIHDLGETSAKFQYTQLCRSLRTYAATFFQVKEKIRGQDQLVPRLLGITRASIMRIDESSKEVLRTWPITVVKRWRVSPNSFTLDFGDYSDSYYSVQTTEGKTIAELIAGYIDIIVQKRRIQTLENKDNVPVTVEDDVESNPESKALAETINNSRSTVNKASEDLASEAVLGSDNTNVDICRQIVTSGLAAMLASTASIIKLTRLSDMSEFDYTAVGSAVTTIANNFTEMTKTVRLLAALSTVNGGGLLKEARDLAVATSAMLNSVHPENMNHSTLCQCAAEMGSVGGHLLELTSGDEIDLKAMVAMSKDVASAIALLVTKARHIAAECYDDALRDQVITSAKEAALATQTLLACTKVLVPCIDSMLCQEQLIELCKVVTAAVEKVVQSAQKACGEEDTLRDLGVAATAVTEAIRSLKSSVMPEKSAHDKSVEAIQKDTENLLLGNVNSSI